MDRQHARCTQPARSASRLAVALLAAAAVTLIPAAASSGEPPEWEREMAVEATCLDWQKVRRCADESGDLQYECVAKSPFAKLWAMLWGDDEQDDEVRVVKVRKAPERSGESEEIRETRVRAEAAAETARADAGVARQGGTTAADAEPGRTVQVKQVVRKQDLPRCSDSR